MTTTIKNFTDCFNDEKSIAVLAIGSSVGFGIWLLMVSAVPGILRPFKMMMRSVRRLKRMLRILPRLLKRTLRILRLLRRMARIVRNLI